MKICLPYVSSVLGWKQPFHAKITLAGVGEHADDEFVPILNTLSQAQRRRAYGWEALFRLAPTTGLFV
jgi:hypothetical protein